MQRILISTIAFAILIGVAASADEPANNAEIACPEGTELKGATGQMTEAYYCMRLDRNGQTQPHGPSILKWESGKVTGQFESGEAVGPWKIENSRFIFTSTVFSQNLPDGQAIAWWKPGVMASRGSFVHGKPEGVWETWYSNGQKRSQIEFKKGKRSGREIYWNKTGFITQAVRNNGDRIISIDRYDSAGRLESRETHPDGDPNSYTWEVFAKNGTRLLDGRYLDNAPVGKWVRRDQAGQVLREQTFPGPISNQGVPLDRPEQMVTPLASERLIAAASSRVFPWMSLAAAASGGLLVAEGFVRSSQVPGSNSLLSWIVGGSTVLFGLVEWNRNEDQFKAPAGEVASMSSATREDRVKKEEAALTYLESAHRSGLSDRYGLSALVALAGVPAIVVGAQQNCYACAALGGLAIASSLLPWVGTAPELTLYNDLKADMKGVFRPEMGASASTSGQNQWYAKANFGVAF